MAEKVGVGVIGCGGMGSGLAGAVAAAPAGRLVAFYDADTARSSALAEKHGGRACGDMEDMLADDEVQAVVVATPPHLHGPQSVAAARAGKHVYVEKPMALSVKACDGMISAARKANVTLMVGQVLRYYEPFHSILRWSSEGRFGKPFHACIQRVGAGWFAKGTWRNNLATVGGTLYEVGAHELDFMRCLLGRPAKVFAVRQKARPADHDIEDVISVLVRFASGASGHYDNGTAWGVGKFTFVLCFEKATLVSDHAFDPKALRALEPAQQPTEIPLEGFETENAVHRQMKSWLDALAHGRRVPVPGEEGRETVRLAELAYRSADTGKALAWPAGDK